MSQAKFNSLEFKALLQSWNEKLKKDGFNDAETGPYLKEWDSFYFQARHDPLTFKLHADYFNLAHQFLNSHKFISEYEKAIWNMHSEGLGYREIAKKIVITQTHTPHCSAYHCDIFCLISTGEFFIANKDKVGLIVKKLKTIMMKKLREEQQEENE